MTTTNHGASLPVEPKVIDLMQALKVSLADTALEDIGRFARDADESERAAAAYAQRPDDAFNSAEYRRLCDAASVAKRVLESACTPARIASLVDAARRGAELGVTFSGPFTLGGVTFSGISLPPMQGGCNCYFKAPTVPVYRANTTHLDDCPARGSGFSVGALISSTAELSRG